MPIRTETFMAQRLYFAQQGAKRSSRPAVRVALAGIIIGMAVMVVTVCVVIGFKRTVTDKIAGFGAHVQVVNFDNNNTYEMKPVAVSDSMLTAIRALPNVKSAHAFWTKPGIIKTDDAFHGIVLKGTDYWDYFRDNLVAGNLPEKPNEVLLSELQAKKMKIELPQDSTASPAYILCYFVGEDISVRKFRVTGIYSTCLGEFDDLFVIGFGDVIRRLNGWNDNQASGVEVLVKDLAGLDDAADNIYFMTANRLDADGNAYYTQTVKQLNPQIFAWLDLLDMNVVIIIVLMLCVSCFNIISGLIILILDSVRLIGTLKALGADNLFVRRIFVTQAAMLIGKGMLWGNAVGLVLCAVQYFTHLIPLEASSYYVNFVPMAFPWGWLLLLNAGVVALSLVVLLAPSAIVTKISPAQVMHFE